MRALSGPKVPDQPADPLIVHPDVRRMLLTCKAFAEGGRLLTYHAATLLDVIEHSADAEERQRADELLSFLTPVVKACLTEWSIERSEEHTSELQSLMRISYAVFCLKKKRTTYPTKH